MAELIEKWKVVDMLTALENEFQHYKPFHGFEHAMYRKLVEVEMEIGKMVSVEAEPVVHAHWIYHEGWDSRHSCSACGFAVSDEVCFEHFGDFAIYGRRCLQCGAHMDEEVADG
jgi:hypothetical protein